MRRQLRETGWLIAGLFGLSVSACGVLAGQPQEPPASIENAELSSRVPELLDRLGSGTLATRASAERELLTLGPVVLEHLPPLDLLRNIGVRQAVGRIRVQLEQAAAHDSLKASLVTLSGRFPLREIVREIEKQTGNFIELKLLPVDQQELPVTCDWSGVRFWDAVSELEALSLESRFNPESGELEFHSVSASQLKQAATEVSRTADVFRIRGGKISTVDPGDGQFLLKCEPQIVCEPRVRPLFLRFSTNYLEMADSDGRKFQSFNPDAQVEVPLGQAGREATLQLAFVGTGSIPNTVSLQGSVSILMAARERPIVFRDLARARGVARRVGGVTVTLTSVQFDKAEPSPDRPSAHIRVRVAYDTATKAFESHQLWLLQNRVYLESPNGVRVPPSGGIDTLHQGDGIVDLEYRFVRLPKTPTDWKYVYVAPTLLVETSLDLSLSGLAVGAD
jgi:hypothetical protein